MKATLRITVQVVALTLLYFVCFAVVSAALLSVPSEQPVPAQAGGALLALLAVSFLNSAVLAYLILRPHLTGWKLIPAILLVFFGVQTVMPQIETAFFVTSLPAGMLPRLFLSGAIMAVLFHAAGSAHGALAGNGDLQFSIWLALSNDIARVAADRERLAK